MRIRILYAKFLTAVDLSL